MNTVIQAINKRESGFRSPFFLYLQKHVFDVLDRDTDVVVVFELFGDLVPRVNDCRVVPSAENVSDGGEWHVEHIRDDVDAPSAFRS